MRSRLNAIVNPIIEWLGGGGVPVSQTQADMRSHICETCPKNVENGWWDRVKSAIAYAIRSHLEQKNMMGLRVFNEDKLGMCKACGCCIKLKVWVPIEHIRNHPSVENFPPWCWIPSESEVR